MRGKRSELQREAIELLCRRLDRNGSAPEPSQRLKTWVERKALELNIESDPEPPDLLVEGLERGTIVALCADTGGAKSFTAQDLVVAVARAEASGSGRSSSRDGHAVIIDEENPARILRSRLRALGLTPRASPTSAAFTASGFASAPRAPTGPNGCAASWSASPPTWS